MIKIPGLIDVHVHLREPGATHKEDWDSGTSAALAGGFTAVLAMPNTKPPIFDRETLSLALTSARQKARCDYAQYIGAGPDNAAVAAGLAQYSAALKMYLDMTYGELRLDDMTLWMEHFAQYPKNYPLVAHSESRTMAAAILMAELFDHPVHIAHISLREEVLLIRKAKERGIKVTCEVCPHHLFLSQDDLPGGQHPRLSGGRGEVRPRLATPADVEALWENLDVIDCFATDHAPHTANEKDSSTPPPGFPGLETALPLLLTAVHNGRLTLDDIIKRLHTNPRAIFSLPEQPDTWVEIDPDEVWTLSSLGMHSRCAWTPFDGMSVRGKVHKVVLRGKTVYEQGRILAEAGSGKNLRPEPKKI